MNNITCQAINSAVTLLPDGNIAPCCIIKNYSKPVSRLGDNDRFSDIKNNFPGSTCDKCVKYNHYYKNFEKYSGNKGVEFLDVRNNNLCNLKCRHCGPTFSSSWAKEIGQEEIFVNTNFDSQLTSVLTENLKDIYFAGGEPLLNPDHWKILSILINNGLSNNISLMYTSNLTTLKYKDTDVFGMWKNFKKVTVNASIDGVGKSFDYMRSNASWQDFDKNIDLIINQKQTNLDVGLAVTLSILNIWFLEDILDYAKTKNLPVSLVQLTDPHYFTLNVMPDDMIESSLSIIEKCKIKNPNLSRQLESAKNTVKNNDDKGSFMQMISTVLLADKIRNENLFDLLPFKKQSVQKIFNNQ